MAAAQVLALVGSGAAAHLLMNGSNTLPELSEYSELLPAEPARPAAEAPAAAEAPVAEAPAEAPKTWAPEALKQTKEQKEELAADAEIAKLKAELKALRGDPLPPADYGTPQV